MTDLGNQGQGSFLEQKQKHFDRLCRNLGLEAGLRESGNGYAILSAGADNVRVFFEHERGSCAFAVGAFADVKPLCGVGGTGFEISSHSRNARRASEARPGGATAIFRSSVVRLTSYVLP
jgi:hypothetical protein